MTSIRNVGNSDIIRTRRGKGVGGTWAHWQVAIAYAKYLDPEFHRLVDEAFREHFEEHRDPALKIRGGIARYQKNGRDDGWIGTRG
jgi:hypothetical protein